jgi:protein SCO1/2
LGPRLLIGLLAATGVLAASVAVFAFSNAGDESGNGAAAAVVQGPKSPFEGATMPAGVRAPDIGLRDQDGRVVRMSDYRGKPVVVTYLYSTCVDACPIAAQMIRGALDDLGHDVPAIAISVDPFRDTPASTKAFLKKQHVAGRMRYVVGTRRELQPVWRGFHIRAQLPDADHSALITLVDRRGMQRVATSVGQMTPETLAHDIRVLEKE